MSENIKEYLNKIKDSNDRTLYTHLSNVLSRILLDNPQNSFDIFEDYSHNVKQLNYDFKKNDEFVDNSNRIREKSGELNDYYDKSRKLLDKLMDGGEEPQEVGPIGYVPNFMEEMKWFEAAGVGFGPEESFRIFKSLSALSFKKQAKQVRLWGKILGSQKDYWVAEGLTEGGEDGELPPNFELRGAKGVNKLNYWVVNDLHEDWVELPLVSPEQICASRKLKKIFTGNLESDVITNPHFDGKEKHLLKCQITRISISTSIIPSGLFVVNADDAREIEPPEDEKKFPDFETLCKLNNWVHQNESILDEGRVSHFKPDNLPEDVDEEKFMLEKVQNDPFEPRLKPLSNDKTPSGYKSAWTIKTYGDLSNYALYQKETGQINYGIIAIRSLYWPGQLTVLHSLYVGYGFKLCNQLYYPQEPEVACEESPDLEGQPEPNFPTEVEQQEGDQIKQNDDEDQ